MTFEALECFAEIARGSTFMNVAEDFNLSQSALSKIIKKTEVELGVQLFDRSGRAVKLTKAGKQLLEDYERMEPAYIALKQHMLQMSSGYTLKVTVGFPAGSYHIRNILEAFRMDHPQISLEIGLPKADRIKMAAADARNNMADMVLMHKTTEYDGNSFVTLVPDDPLLAIIPKNHRLVSKEEVTLEDLREETVLANNWVMEILQELARNYQFLFPNVSEWKMTREDILWNIIAGHGISIFHQSDIEHISMNRTVVKKIQGLDPCPVLMFIRDTCPAPEDCAVLRQYIIDALRSESKIDMASEADAVWD